MHIITETTYLNENKTAASAKRNETHNCTKFLQNQEKHNCITPEIGILGWIIRKASSRYKGRHLWIAFFVNILGLEKWAHFMLFSTYSANVIFHHSE